jgi:phage N-6-adenine-methyltransferase
MQGLVPADEAGFFDALDADDARALTDQIRTSMEDMAPLIERAVRGRAWAALGYQSWHDYVVGEFGGPLRLGREERQEAVLRLRQGGLSTPAIGMALGVSDETVRRDLISTNVEMPDTITTLDGRSYPAHRESQGLGRLAPLMTSDTPEWYTPRHVLDFVVRALGRIDLDPCSNSHDNPNVPAARHFTSEDDGLSRTWLGRVYMNPPYGREIGEWTRKLADEYAADNVSEAIALVPARTDTEWFRAFPAELVCFVSGRLAFSEHENAAPFPSAVLYLGENGSNFASVFSALGTVYARLP